MQALLESIHFIWGIEASISHINYHGMTDQEIITRLLEKYDVDAETIRSNLKDCVEYMPVKYNEIVKSENIVMLEGVFDFLTELGRNGFILGLVTGNLEKIARAKLKKIGINHFFEIGGFGSDHINRANLVKIAIRRAEEKFGIDNNKKIFLFGDTPQDMKAGKAGGVMPIGVTTGIYSSDQLLAAGAHKVLPNLKDTDDILTFLFNLPVNAKHSVSKSDDKGSADKNDKI